MTLDEITDRKEAKIVVATFLLKEVTEHIPDYLSKAIENNQLPESVRKPVMEACKAYAEQLTNNIAFYRRSR